MPRMLSGLEGLEPSSLLILVLLCSLSYWNPLVVVPLAWERPMAQSLACQGRHMS